MSKNQAVSLFEACNCISEHSRYVAFNLFVELVECETRNGSVFVVAFYKNDDVCFVSEQSEIFNNEQMVDAFVTEDFEEAKTRYMRMIAFSITEFKQIN